jgi:DNA adenine methylase
VNNLESNIRKNRAIRKPDLEALRALPSLAERKNALLAYLDNSRNGVKSYRRFALSPIRYAGGKSLAVGHIVEHLPDDISTLVSPFFGGGSLEIACSKYLGLKVTGFDIFDILVNFWQFQINSPDVLYSNLLELRPEKEEFEKIRLILNQVWKKNVELDPLTLATYYVYNFNLSYGPGFMGWASKIYLDATKYQRMIERIRDFQPGDLSVNLGDFRDVIRSNSNEFLYCDPPYLLGDDSKMFKGIYPMRNIPVHHNGFPHEELRDLLRNHKGGFVLSYNDSPTIREYYKEFDFYFPEWQYTMGQGETRIGSNRVRNGDDHTKASHEILIVGRRK